MNSRIILSVVSNTQDDVLTALRQATAERHAELDARTPLGAARPDLRAYRDHLRLLEAWLAPTQDWLAAFDDGLSPRDYLRLIRADLAHAALADEVDEVEEVEQAPAPWSWPAESDAAYRWGVRYVIEGSQLGGAVLYKRLAQRLAPHPLDYLRGAGSPGPRWQRFIAALRAEVTTPAQIEAACRGARQAFDSLIALNRIALNREINSSSAQPAGRP
jgi:heme oxygenase